jgi:predicted N-acetyltransferase YhbS
MATLIDIGPGDAIPDLRSTPFTSPLTEDELNTHKPDRHLIVVDGAAIRARVSCWWSDAPPLSGERAGVVGHYAASDDISGARVLDEAVARLEAAGCSVAVGPMDGNTWRRYRLIVEPGNEPAFFLEPGNPAEWVSHFTSAGFETLATYTSALTTRLAGDPLRLAEKQGHLRHEHIEIRSMTREETDDALRRIFRLSLESFRSNYLYTPISEDEFLAQNRRLLPMVIPDLVLLAERADALVGFLFAVPDVLQRQRGQTVDTIIIKTVAVSPAVANAGVGGALVALAHDRAHTLGFSRAIHALMHEQNVSQRISQHYAQTIRRYALFKRTLSPRRNHTSA